MAKQALVYQQPEYGYLVSIPMENLKKKKEFVSHADHRLGGWHLLWRIAVNGVCSHALERIGLSHSAVLKSFFHYFGDAKVR